MKYMILFWHVENKEWMVNSWFKTKKEALKHYKNFEGLTETPYILMQVIK